MTNCCYLQGLHKCRKAVVKIVLKKRPNCQRSQHRPHQYAVTEALTATQVGDALQGSQNCALFRKVPGEGHLGNNLAVQKHNMSNMLTVWSRSRTFDRCGNSMQTSCRLCIQRQRILPNVHIQLGGILSVKQCLQHKLILANMLLTSTSNFACC